MAHSDFHARILRLLNLPPEQTSDASPFRFPILEIADGRDMERARSGHPEGFIALSPPSAGAVLGVSWWLELTGGLAPLSILDCGNVAHHAAEAVSKGIGLAICRGFDFTPYAPLKDKILSGRPDFPSLDSRRRAASNP